MTKCSGTHLPLEVPEGPAVLKRMLHADRYLLNLSKTGTLYENTQKLLSLKIINLF
jgi:hypothetical protein